MIGVAPFLQIEGDMLQFKSSRFDFGNIQNVIDDIEQTLSRIAAYADVFSLFRIQGTLRKKLSHTQYSVHGRSNFMAHAGQKITFCPIGRLCRLFRLAGGLVKEGIVQRNGSNSGKTGQNVMTLRQKNAPAFLLEGVLFHYYHLEGYENRLKGINPYGSA